ncbi:MAG TPA: UV DNA damage repair endonuclease UvsE [Chloroflexia bacterium]|nr:UV DNA damage repair endonuclease UvsE [Chloroflexia bacterium]
MRLGFACTVMGLDVRAHDTRKWQNNPHLRVSLENVAKILHYAHGLGISMYRLSSNLAPYYTDPSRPQFSGQLEESRQALADTGALARGLDIRLSMHPGQYTVLNSPNEAIYQAAVRELRYAADVLDYMQMPYDNKVIVHIGGAYGDKGPALQRWIERYPLLPANVRARLVIENDDTIFNVADALYVSGHTGVPIVFDNLHHRVNPSALSGHDVALDEAAALHLCLDTWPADQRPKVHYSDQRTQPVLVRVKGKGTRTQAPSAGAHADYVDPAGFLAFLQRAGDPRFDVMFEAKAKELAVLRVMDYVRGKDTEPPRHQGRQGPRQD